MERRGLRPGCPGSEPGLGEDTRNLEGNAQASRLSWTPGKGLQGWPRHHQGAARATGLNLSVCFPRVGRFTPCFGGGGGELELSVGPAESPSALLPPPWPLGPLEPPPHQQEIMSIQPRRFQPGQYLSSGSGEVAMETGLQGGGSTPSRQRARGAGHLCLISV